MVVWSRFYLYQNYQGLEYYLSHRCIVLSPININEKGGPNIHISQTFSSILANRLYKSLTKYFSDVVVTTNVQSNVANTAIMCRHNGELDNKASSSSNWQKSQGICFDKPATINISTIVKPRPKSQTPKAQPQPSQIQSKSVPKGLGLTLKSYGPPPPPHPPLTFKHEGGL